MKKIIAFLMLSLVSFLVHSQPAQRFFSKEQLITSGIYYYPEQWPQSQWERDIKKIAEMGFEFVHLAEFAWFKMEPQEGRFEFAWLDEVVQLCIKYNLKVVMCTPSATTPAWMRLKYPETFIMDGHYIRAENGTRGLGSITNQKYRYFVNRIVTALAKRYGNNKNVIGWQIDNEPPAITDYSPSSQTAFRQWLKKKYKTIDALNAAWGTAFWSQWFNGFEEVVIPNTNLVGWWGNNPHALLDLKRYLADSQAEFLDMQAGILKQYCAEEQFTTTNYTAISTGADALRTQKLDFATYTAYPNGGSDNIGAEGFRLGNSKLVLFAATYYQQLGGVSGVMEMQPGPVNWGSYNPLLLPGTVRMWLYHSFAAGGRIACSYRFRQVLYSAEQYHAGTIKTDGITPSPGGEEYVQFNKEMKQLRALYKPAAALPPKLAARKTAILWNLENFWSIDRQRQTYQWDTWNYPIRFLEIARSFGAPVDIINEKTELSAYNIVIVPAYEMVDSLLVQKWKDYVDRGGHLVVTCRTGVKDRFGHFWEDETAAPVAQLVGTRITATDMLAAHHKGDILMNDRHYQWNDWADLLEPAAGTEVLAVYDNQFYKGNAAVVQRKIGKGTVWYIGVSTDDAKLETALLKKVYTKAGATTESYPPGLLVYWRDGFYIGVNYSSDNYPVQLPANATTIIGESVIKPAGVLVWKED